MARLTKAARRRNALKGARRTRRTRRSTPLLGRGRSGHIPLPILESRLRKLSLVVQHRRARGR